MKRPAASEYVPYFSAYVQHAEDHPLAQLRGQLRNFAAFRAFTEEQASADPALGEWSLKEVLQHLSDFERVFAYRALRFSRGDLAPIEAFEQDEYIAASNANGRPLSAVLDELLSLREATLLFFESVTPAMLERVGSAGGNPVSVRALVFITAGHSEVHLRDMRRTFVPPSHDR